VLHHWFFNIKKTQEYGAFTEERNYIFPLNFILRFLSESILITCIPPKKIDRYLIRKTILCLSLDESVTVYTSIFAPLDRFFFFYKNFYLAIFSTTFFSQKRVPNLNSLISNKVLHISTLKPFLRI